jgi:hypothetical protein
VAADKRTNLRIEEMEGGVQAEEDDIFWAGPQFFLQGDAMLP